MNNNILFFIFRLGEEFDETTTDGRTVKTTVVKEGDNKLITTQKAVKAGEKDVVAVGCFEILFASIICIYDR